jgi:short subunit dehydrogenase-like uncharacterized protein
MSGRIVVCGATGHTGARTAATLVAAGIRPLLAGRNRQRLDDIASELGGLDTAVVDLTDPATIERLLAAGDVLVSTVGPFAEVGDPPLAAAIAAGASYVDCTGEPSFARKVFRHYGPYAESAGVALLPAFGYDFVPGNLAAALALQAAGADACRVDVGYYLTGSLRAAAGPAARASLARAVTEPMFAWRNGLVEAHGAQRMRRFLVDGQSRPALSIGATEHLTLPRSFDRLDEVNVYLGWFGPATQPLHRMSWLGRAVTSIPVATDVIRRAARVAIDAATVDPTPETMARTRSWVAATAHDRTGNVLAEIALTGPHHLDLTAALLAWAARRLANGAVTGVGALGPVDAFGINTLATACAAAGLEPVEQLTR